MTTPQLNSNPRTLSPKPYTVQEHYGTQDKSRLPYALGLLIGLRSAEPFSLDQVMKTKLQTLSCLSSIASQTQALSSHPKPETYRSLERQALCSDVFGGPTDDSRQSGAPAQPGAR